MAFNYVELILLVKAVRWKRGRLPATDLSCSSGCTSLLIGPPSTRIAVIILCSKGSARSLPAKHR